MNKKGKKAAAKEEYDKFYVEHSYYHTKVPDSYKNRKSFAPLNQKELVAAIPGTIQEIFVKKGQKIEANEKLLILEAMKMRNIISHAVDGQIKKIHIKKGDIVSKNQLLVEFE
jgi:biotin carboxyl carrier protein